MPPEALLKKRDEKEFNNFVLEPLGISSPLRPTNNDYTFEKTSLKNNGILKLKLASIG